MNVSKLAAPHLIHPATVKPLADVQLFDRLLDEGRFPADRLTPTVKPVHRGGDRDKSDSYTPMILTFIALKTLETALSNRTVNHLEANKLGKMEQHGF